MIYVTDAESNISVNVVIRLYVTDAESNISVDVVALDYLYFEIYN